ncbi:MAG: DNA repair protein RecN [Marinilabiliales bacterium]|nr:MAG: DNA repair protein RecN [Marinilabiliales bacterium]
MLKSLYIKNYALIKSLEIDFETGFSVITGETGAGKSILLGALSLILGKRADSSNLFDDKAKCIVEGSFDLSNLNLISFFANNELDYEDVSFLRREILPSGKSRAFINDTPVNLNLLKNLGNQLVDIHSQHETLKLGYSDFQMEVLDKFGTNEKLLSDYINLYSTFKDSQVRLKNMIHENEQAKRDEDYFKFQMSELDTININDSEFQELLELSNYLAHAEEVKQVTEKAAHLLLENDESVFDKISEITDEFGKISDFHKQFREIYERMTSLKIELKDIAEEIEGFSFDTDTENLNPNQVNEKLDNIYKLQQKHNVKTIEELISIRTDFENKLANISGLEDQIIQLEKEILSQKTELEIKAKELSSVREKNSILLTKSIKSKLTKLGMSDADFTVSFNKLDEFGNRGLDKIDFLFSANKGSKNAEIGKIASGGELSRLMLAVKSLITSRKLLPTIIFDEIDSGVSGDIAGKVGNMLKQMSENHQIIAITHLPQIASKANSHYFVYKENESGRTSSMINLLNTKQRIEEVAKMLSDEEVTDVARKAAMDLLS